MSRNNILGKIGADGCQKLKFQILLLFPHLEHCALWKSKHCVDKLSEDQLSSCVSVWPSWARKTLQRMHWHPLFMSFTLGTNPLPNYQFLNFFLKVRDCQKKIVIIYRLKQICRFTILNSSFEFSRVFCYIEQNVISKIQV